MGHDLRSALDHEGVAAEFLLESGVRALGDARLVIADRFGRVEFDLLAAARIVIDQRHVAKVLAVLPQLAAAVGGIHEIVEIGHPLGADPRQGTGGQTVVHRGTGEQR